ncbi:MAG: hypothetical protein ABI797_05890 [Chloroflexota bacterium]
MTEPPKDSPISRAPVLVLIGGMALAIGLVLLGAALAARPVDEPPSGSPGVAGAPREINVILRDYRFDPTPLYLYGGETVRLSVLNGGMLEHELVLGDANVQAAWAAANAAAASPAPFATPPPASAPAGTGGVRVLLQSGAVTSVVYAVPVNEQLQLICHLPGHVERGMIGQVTLISR